MAYSEGAFSADTDADGAADQPNPAPASVESTAVPTTTPESSSATTPTENSAAAEAASETSTSSAPSTTAPSSTVAETTPAEPPVVSSLYADGVYLGTAEYTEWGDVQVQVTISDGAIVEVAAVDYPTGRKSSSINGRAVPVLEADAIAVQGADLDIVSGATYTSRTYADSLQAALDQAAIASAQEGSTS